MKTKLYSVFFTATFIITCNLSNAQADNQLSNLVSPTKVNVPLLPVTDNSKNLGSATKSWKDFYLDGSVYMGGARFIAYQTGTGTNNTAVGAAVLKANTTGSYNTGIGFNALFLNTTGSYNTANGNYALYYNSTGNSNTAVGNDVLFYNTEGNYNTAIGRYALNFNTTGSYNTATGGFALANDTSGYDNTANGYRALLTNSSGYNNTATGFDALRFNRTGYDNTASGYDALYTNTTGFNNTSIGASTLVYNTTGHDNAGIGIQALDLNTTGSYNIAIGRNALYENTTGNSNTGVGYGAGAFNDNNTYCSYLGYDADQSVSTNFTNSTAIGKSSRITESNQVRIGNSSVSSIGGYVGWSNISDGRYKKNVKQDVPGLEFINQLKPVTYNLDITGVRKFLGEDVSADEKMKDARLPARAGTDGNEEVGQGKQVVHEKDPAAEALVQQGIAAKEKIIYTGFIAQEVEAAAKKLNYDFSGVDKPQDENGLYGLRYAEFVVPLVKAVQELSAANDAKDAKIAAQEKINIDLQTQIDELKAMFVNNGSLQSKTTVNLTSASLEQNIPNPFNHSTTINYTLPQQFSSAKIIITDKAGKTLKEINLPAGRQGIAGNERGSLNVDASSLASGAYQYSLYVDGGLIGTKQMVLAK